MDRTSAAAPCGRWSSADALYPAPQPAARSGAGRGRRQLGRAATKDRRGAPGAACAGDRQRSRLGHQRTARLLIEAGIGAIDVAVGRHLLEPGRDAPLPHRAPAPPRRSFRRWGIPTAESLQAVCATRAELDRPDLPVFASGGIRTGQDIANVPAPVTQLLPPRPFSSAPFNPPEAVVEEMELLMAELRSRCSAAAPISPPCANPTVLARQ